LLRDYYLHLLKNVWTSPGWKTLNHTNPRDSVFHEMNQNQWWLSMDAVRGLIGGIVLEEFSVSCVPEARTHIIANITRRSLLHLRHLFRSICSTYNIDFFFFLIYKLKFLFQTFKSGYLIVNSLFSSFRLEIHEHFQ
jgi:hypothetical protein